MLARLRGTFRVAPLISGPTDFEGVLGEIIEVDFTGTAGGDMFEKFRAKVRAFLRNHPPGPHRYTWLDGDRGRLRVGFTALVRDAEIRLEQGAGSATTRPITSPGSTSWR